MFKYVWPFQFLFPPGIKGLKGSERSQGLFLYFEDGYIKVQDSPFYK